MDATPHFPIYMDYGATTPVDPRVVDAMIPWLREHFGNPASRSHAWGWEAEEAVEKARQDVADLIGADPREVVWTSGATESNNLAIKGAAHFYQSRGKHLITVKTEHKAVLDTMRELERQGFEVTYLDVQEDGLLSIAALQAAIRPDTILISVMFVNNEIGVIQDIAAIGNLCREKGIVFHVDAAQATGKVSINLQDLQVDLMSLASHKTYGPKGIGALYVRRKPRVRLEAQMHGGGHERGMRSGTLPTHQCVGMGEAFRLAKLEMAQDLKKAQSLHQRLLSGLQGLDQVFVNGHLTQRVPHNLNISFNFVEGSRSSWASKGWQFPQDLHARRQVWSPAMFCVPWDAAMSLHTAVCGSPLGGTPLSMKLITPLKPSSSMSTNCVISVLCGKCIKKVLTSAPFSGLPTETHPGN